MLNVVRTLTALAMFAASYVATTVWLQSQSMTAPRAYVHKIYEGQGHGSMVLIAPGLAITAAHVAIHEGLLVNGQPTKVLKINEDVDLALVQVSADCPCAPLGSMPAPDEQVVGVGFPLDEGEWATKGTVQNYKPHFIRTSVPIAFGNSGGGLFQFQEGEWKLVGIASHVPGASLGMFGGIPVFTMSSWVSIDTIKEFIGYELERI